MTSCTTNSNMAVLGVEGFRSVFITEPRSEQAADLSPVTPPKNFDAALADMIAEAKQEQAQEQEQQERERQLRAMQDAPQNTRRTNPNVLRVSMDLLTPVASEYPLFVSSKAIGGVQTVTYFGATNVGSEPRIVFEGTTGEENYRVQVVSRGGEGLLVARQNVQPFSDKSSKSVTEMYSGVNNNVRNNLTEALGFTVTRAEIGYKPAEALLVTFRKPHSL
jgi:hypothetical protein